MNDVLYRFAIDHLGNLIEASELSPTDRKSKGPFLCVGCNTELVPKLGEVKVWHFAHKSIEKCAGETYLHKLAKNNFYRLFNECLQSGKGFYLKRKVSGLCDHNMNIIWDSCNYEMEKEVDLTKYFNEVYLEKGNNGFIADVLLRSSTTNDVMFIEFVVSHECSSEKIASGEKIIEIKAGSEDAILELNKTLCIKESDTRVKTYNLKDLKITGDLCAGNCIRQMNVFAIFNTGRTFLRPMRLGEILRYQNSDLPEKLVLFETMAPVIDSEWKTERHKALVRQCHFDKGIKAKSCFLCKYYALESRQVKGEVFCKFKKTAVESQEAVKCEIFRPLRSNAACEQIDEENRKYREKRRELLKKWR